MKTSNILTHIIKKPNLETYLKQGNRSAALNPRKTLDFIWVEQMNI